MTDARPIHEHEHEPRIIACLGASMTEAKGSFDWIADLAARAENSRFRFRNFGVGGDLAYNALARLPRVLECRPERVIVLVGTNDVLALTSARARRALGAWKRLPRDPSPDWYEENLRAIARRLKSGSSARVAFCSLPPIGEAPESTDSLQQALNRCVAQFRTIIERVAKDEGASYVPFYERMHEQIVASPGRSFTSFRFLPMYRDALRLFVLRRSLDEIAERNGWRFHTDGIHLNTRGGKILVSVVQELIDDVRGDGA